MSALQLPKSNTPANNMAFLWVVPKKMLMPTKSKGLQDHWDHDHHIYDTHIHTIPFLRYMIDDDK